VIPAAFDYVRAESVAQALDALDAEDAKVIAGGHSLIPMMKLRVARPSRLVDIAGLRFRGVTDGSGLTIGALTTYDELIRDAEARVPDALRECAESVGDLQVRNAGTVGGGLAHADPASDIAAGVLALDATVRLVSRSGERVLSASELFLGPFATALGAQELLTEIVVPEQPAGSGSAYLSIEDQASGYPIVGAAVVATLDHGRLGSCAIGITGIAGCPFRADDVEAALLAASPDERAEAIRASLPEVEIAVDEDERAYKRHVAAVVVERAVARALERAEAAS
jgi:carbon-monoxide dehydrogenase medium subunit